MKKTLPSNFNKKNIDIKKNILNILPWSYFDKKNREIINKLKVKPAWFRTCIQNIKNGLQITKTVDKKDVNFEKLKFKRDL